MHDGKIVEQGTADQVCEHPKDPYTQDAARRGADPGPARGRAGAADCGAGDASA